MEEREGREPVPQQVMMACPQEGYKLFPANAEGIGVCEEELDAPQYPCGSDVMVTSILRMTFNETSLPSCAVWEHGLQLWA